MKEINNGQLKKEDIKKKVTLKGWVSNRRKLGGLVFIDLRDRWGITQIVTEQEPAGLTKESVIEVFGEVVLRKEANPKIATGEIEILATEIIVLANSDVPPFVVKNDVDAKEETRLENRFLDLRRPKMVENLTLRHKFISAVRNFLNKKDFLEIETPYLSKSTPEGARDYLVPTRTENKFFALPQSPQIYKQLLMASGIERYYQIARCFRDEDLRSDRQPEFTQLDIEVSFTTEEEIKKMIEKMMYEVFSGLGHIIKPPFREIRYEEALNRFGTDKPDLRFDFELQDVSGLFTDSGFNVFKSASSVKMIAFDKVLNKKDIKVLEEVAKKNQAQGLFWAAFDSKTEEKTGPGFKFIEKELHIITKENNIKTGTLLFVADKQSIANKSLGAVRTKLNEMFSLANDNLEFAWIIDWPAFEYSDTEERYIAAHHPFTAISEDTLDNFDINQEHAKAKAYDLVLNGFEIGGGSIRINDINIQKRMFNAIGMSKEQAQEQFGFFLKSFNYGLPPHGGIAFGIDRIIAILAKENSIRDVIAFPKNAKGIDPLSKSPSEVNAKQLDEYNLKVK